MSNSLIRYVEKQKKMLQVTNDIVVDRFKKMGNGK
jgi:hypothetical protein